MIKTEIQQYSFGEINVKVCVPNNHDLFLEYKQKNEHQLFPVEGQKSNFPYWAKVWHSAIALSEFIVKNVSVFEHKKILELAAGLGLPSIVASVFAKNILITDYIGDALYYVNQSIIENKITNTTTQVVDWNKLPNNIDCDVIMMSDVNYDANEFEALNKMILHFLNAEKTIVLATPQRLVAKNFIKNLLPFTVNNQLFEIDVENDKQQINIIVLQQK